MPAFGSNKMTSFYTHYQFINKTKLFFLYLCIMNPIKRTLSSLLLLCFYLFPLFGNPVKPVFLPSGKKNHYEVKAGYTSLTFAATLEKNLQQTSSFQQNDYQSFGFGYKMFEVFNKGVLEQSFREYNQVFSSSVAVSLLSAALFPFHFFW